MNTQQIQLKISLSEQLDQLLNARAAALGIPVTQFVKHLIIKEVEQDAYPVFAASKDTEEKAIKALKDRDKAIKVTSITDYFTNL